MPLGNAIVLPPKFYLPSQKKYLLLPDKDLLPPDKVLLPPDKDLLPRKQVLPRQFQIILILLLILLAIASKIQKSSSAKLCQANASIIAKWQTVLHIRT